MKHFTAYELKQFLDIHVVGQDHVKQSISVLLSNKAMNNELYNTIHYSTLLLIGPAGVGKTILLKKAAEYIDAPLTRISALSLLSQHAQISNYTNIIIEQLIDHTIKHKTLLCQQKYSTNALQLAKDKVIDILSKLLNEDRAKIRKNFNKQKYNQTIIPISSHYHYQDQLTNNTHMPVTAAIQFIQEKELEIMLSMHDFSHEAIHEVQLTGIVIIDDIDKLAVNPFTSNTSAQTKQLEICQRQLTELLSGIEIHTKYGTINSRGLVFVCMGHFNDTQISHLLPELQSKLLNISYCQSLTKDDMLLILTSIENNLLSQYIKMLKTLQLDINLDFDAIEALCDCAYNHNQTETNLGIIRLYSLIDKLFEPFFLHTQTYKNHATSHSQSINITKEYILELFTNPEETYDYSRYIL